MAISYLNGDWQPVAEAKISVLDRGFLFGDGVYEVIPVYAGKAFGLKRHLQRLHNSIEEIRMQNPLTEADWEILLLEALERSGETLASLYVQVTRGADINRNFVYPEKPEPTIFIMVNAAPVLARQEITPYSMITLEDFRWDRGHIKTISLIAAGILKNQALAEGANDAILIKDGFVTEATASNVFVVLDGVIVTPAKSTRLLHGITRDVIVELAISNGLSVEERSITPDELAKAEEIFISSSTHEAWPVTKLNGAMVGNGEPGLVWQQIDQLFQANKLA